MRKLFSLLLISALFVTACETGNEIEAKPSISVTTGEVLDYDTMSTRGGEFVHKSKKVESIDYEKSRLVVNNAKRAAAATKGLKLR